MCTDNQIPYYIISLTKSLSKANLGIDTSCSNAVNYKRAWMITLLMICFPKPQLENCSKIKNYPIIHKYETVNEKALLKWGIFWSQ